MKTEIREAAENDIETILDFMKSYYEFDSLDYDRGKLRATIYDFFSIGAGSLKNGFGTRDAIFMTKKLT